MAHIRNVHLQFRVAVFKRQDDHGIVEVPRRLAINGHNGQIAKVLAPDQFSAIGRLDGLPGALLCLCQYVRRKRVGDPVLPDDDLHIHAKRIWRPKNLQQTPDCRPSGLGKTGDLNLHGQALEWPALIALLHTANLSLFGRRRVVRKPGSTRQCLFPQCSVRRRRPLGHNLGSGRNLDWATQPIVPGLDIVSLGQLKKCAIPRALGTPRSAVMEHAHYCLISSRQNARDSTRAASVPVRRVFIH